MENTPSHHTDPLQTAYRAMCHTGNYDAAFIKVHFQLRLKANYRTLPNSVKVFYTLPEAIPERELKTHPMFNKPYENLTRIATHSENNSQKAILMTDYAIKKGPIEAMIAVSCASFCKLLMTDKKEPCKQILRLSAHYPTVKDYVLQSDIGKEYFKNTKYFSAIKEMAGLDAKFALEALQDISIRAQFLTNSSDTKLLEIVEALYNKILSPNPDSSAIKDILTLIAYITQTLQISFAESQKHHIQAMKHTLINRMSQDNTHMSHQASAIKGMQNHI